MYFEFTMTYFDISGPIRPGTWHYGAPYFPFQIQSISTPDWMDFPVYAESISMPMQTGTYIETAGHVYPNQITTAQIPLERTILLPSFCLQMPSSARSEITKAMILDALTRIGSPSLIGKGLIISTGWFKHWFDPEYLSDGPFFSPDVMEFMVASKVGLLGSDMPCWDSPTHPTGHLLTYFKSDGLMLAPLYDTDRLGEGSGQLIAIPLAIEDTSASPVRAVWVA